MAVSQKQNEEYWALKDRISRWGFTIILICPFIILPMLTFGGAYFGSKLFPSHGGLVGFLIGGFTAYATCLTLWIKKVGFLIYSKEKCQKCGTPIGRYNGIWFVTDYLCRECGNNNSVKLHAT